MHITNDDIQSVVANVVQRTYGGIGEGMKVRGENIIKLRYTDNTVLIGDNANDLKGLIDRVLETCESYTRLNYR